MERIRSLESLRGLLAMWVVIGHTIKHAGYSPGELGVLRLAALPELAVDVFIILSGFVIFLLLDQQKASYGQFVLKRWFRIAPLFLAVLLVSALTLEWQAAVIASAPFPGHAINNDLQLHRHALEYLPQHVFAHVLMLHGLVPDGVLPSSAFAVVGQGWSISVEWQFYLVAPLLFALVRGKRWHLLALAVLFLCVLRVANHAGIGFAVNQMNNFIIGIVSYYLWKHSDRLAIEPCLFDLLALVLAVLVWMSAVRSFPLLVWLGVMYFLVMQKLAPQGRTQRALASVLHSGPLLALGTISYSVYLVHMLVLYLVRDAMATILPEMSQGVFTALLLLVVSGVTITVSMVTYRFVELPGMALGRRLSQSVAMRKVGPAVA